MHAAVGMPLPRVSGQERAAPTAYGYGRGMSPARPAASRRYSRDRCRESPGAGSACPWRERQAKRGDVGKTQSSGKGAGGDRCTDVTSHGRHTHRQWFTHHQAAYYLQRRGCARAACCRGSRYRPSRHPVMSTLALLLTSRRLSPASLVSSASPPPATPQLPSGEGGAPG